MVCIKLTSRKISILFILSLQSSLLLLLTQLLGACCVFNPEAYLEFEIDCWGSCKAIYVATYHN